jgi:Ca2+-binding RTX toxin-like protein
VPRQGWRIGRGALTLAALATCLFGAISERSAAQVVHFDRTSIPRTLLDVELAAIDGDADNDLIGCLPESPVLLDVRFLPNTRGYFAPGERQTAVGDLCMDVVPVQLDGDGVMDLAVSEWYPHSEPRDPELVSLLGNGDGTFEEVARQPLLTPSQQLETGDFDDDGLADVAAGESTGDRVEVFSGRGDGTFDPPVPQPVGRRPASLAVGDLDANGVDDLVVANRGSDDLSVLLGEPSQGLGTETRVGKLRYPVDVEVVDIGSDDVLDAVALASGSGLSLFRGSGDGGLARGRELHRGRRAKHVASGDFNGDSRADLAVTWRQELGVFFSTRGSRFTRATAFALGPPRAHTYNEAESIATGPIDRDGQTDIIAPVPGLMRFLATKQVFRCGGKVGNLVGSSEDDALSGFESIRNRPRVVVGRNGDDESAGGPHADLACMGRGDDAFYLAEGGDDVIHAGSGDDGPLKGGNDDDVIVGGPGDDLLGQHKNNPEAGDDVLRGGKGRDLLDGGPGWDVCDGGPGRDGAVGCERLRNIP